jgi:hypothetical protein
MSMSVVTVSAGSSLRSAVVDATRRFSFDMSALVALLVEFDLSGEWAFDGAPSCAHWVADRADVEVCTVREWLRVGHALSVVDEVARRFADGRLSYSKVRTLTRVATVDNQQVLCEIAARVPAGRLAVALAREVTRNESPEDRDRRHRAATRLGWRVDADGMVAGSWRLPPQSAALLTAAVDAMVVRAQRGQSASAGGSPSPSVARWPSVAQQRADALVGLITGGGARFVTEIVLHVRGDGCAFDDSTPIANSVVERLAPAAFLRALIHDAEGRPINASSRRRHPTARQRRVVRERDRCCVDCGSIDLLQYDHQPDYEMTHRTIVEELRVRCATCHHKRHAGAAGAAGN